MFFTVPGGGIQHIHKLSSRVMETFGIGGSFVKCVKSRKHSNVTSLIGINGFFTEKEESEPTSGGGGGDGGEKDGGSG